jgi:transposase InsO family protein
LKKKSDTTKAIKDYLKPTQTQYDSTVKTLCTDNGGEYIYSKVESLLADLGIVLQNSPPCEHESNGLAERFNRTIATEAYTMLMDHPKSLWAKSIACATYLYNRLVGGDGLVVPSWLALCLLAFRRCSTVSIKF